VNCHLAFGEFAAGRAAANCHLAFGEFTAVGEALPKAASGAAADRLR
jgi:hypothetical protein